MDFALYCREILMTETKYMKNLLITLPLITLLAACGSSSSDNEVIPDPLPPVVEPEPEPTPQLNSFDFIIQFHGGEGAVQSLTMSNSPEQTVEAVNIWDYLEPRTQKIYSGSQGGGMVRDESIYAKEISHIEQRIVKPRTAFDDMTGAATVSEYKALVANFEGSKGTTIISEPDTTPIRVKGQGFYQTDFVMDTSYSNWGDRTLVEFAWGKVTLSLYVPEYFSHDESSVEPTTYETYLCVNTDSGSITVPTAVEFVPEARLTCKGN